VSGLRRGRPPKPTYKHAAGFSDALSADEHNELKCHVAAISGSRLGAPEIESLSRELSRAAAYYRCAEAMRPKVRRFGGPTTNKPKNLAPLLADCFGAWTAATGEQPARWCALNRPGKGQAGVRTRQWVEPVPFQLARAAYEVATGRRLTQDLRRQALAAVKIIASTRA
jgi:hypothetical protein